jgi:hypothetical protein
MEPSRHVLLPDFDAGRVCLLPASCPGVVLGWLVPFACGADLWWMGGVDGRCMGQVMEDPVSTVDGFTYDRALIESWLLLHDTSPCSGAVLSSKQLVPNSVLKAAIQEYADITREKARIEEAKRQLLEHQHFVLRRENALHQVMQAQRTLQIAQARQEAETCALLQLGGGPAAAAGSEGASAQTEHERMLAAEGRRRAEEEKEKERRREEQRMQELLAAEEEERKREYERQERELKLQVCIVL